MLIAQSLPFLMPTTITDRNGVATVGSALRYASLDLKPAAGQLLEHLRRQERSLLRRHGVRLRVDRFSADGRNALCSCTQIRRPFFKSTLSDHELVGLAHHTLKELHLFGITPLIGIVPRSSTNAYAPLERNDPFWLIQALRAAGQDDVLYQGVPSVPPVLVDHLTSVRTTLRSVA